MVALSSAMLWMAIMLQATFSCAFIPHHGHTNRAPFLSQSRTSPAGESSSSALWMGMNRRARRQQKKQNQANKSRDKKFYDAVKAEDEDNISGVPVATAEKTKKKQKKGANGEATPKTETPVSGGGSVTDAVADEQPELSTVVVDEETGFERIAQGKAVMDVITRKAVELSPLGPEYRLAQFFPGVAPPLREKYRFQNWASITVPEMVDALRAACTVPFKQNITDETTGKSTGEMKDVVDIPPHPIVANQALDFVTANRDYLGSRMKKTLGRLKLRAQSLGNVEEARSYRQLWKHFLTIENSLSAPFRQMVMDAEGIIGPNFGNLDLKSYAGGELYQRCASYIVLKGMVAHWEKKYKDANFVESNEQGRENFMTVLGTGDPKRYLPNPPIIYKLEEVTRITAMAQQMSMTFVNETSLFDDLPVELRFIEAALVVTGGTELRRFAVEEFCPKEGITPEALREGVSRLYEQLHNMQIDPYGELTNVVGRLAEALAVGTDDGRDPYKDYLYNFDRNGPGYFETYTMDEDRNSLVRFLDGAKRMTEDSAVGGVDDVVGQLRGELSAMFGSSGPKPTSTTDDAGLKAVMSALETYKVPEKRAVGRPHNIGWLDWLEEDRVEKKDIYEAENWRDAYKEDS